LRKCPSEPSGAILSHFSTSHQLFAIFDCVDPLLFAFRPVRKRIPEFAARVDIRDCWRGYDLGGKWNSAWKFKRYWNCELYWSDRRTRPPSPGIDWRGTRGGEFSADTARTSGRPARMLRRVPILLQKAAGAQLVRSRGAFLRSGDGHHSGDFPRQHFLNFLPLPQGQGSLRPTSRNGLWTGRGARSSAAQSSRSSSVISSVPGSCHAG
jgi:hypothetical protein